MQKKIQKKKQKDIHSKLYEEYSEKKKHRTIQSDDIDESKEKNYQKKIMIYIKNYMKIQKKEV